MVQSIELDESYLEPSLEPMERAHRRIGKANTIIDTVFRILGTLKQVIEEGEIA